jgi:hypothetical protein
MPIGGPVPVFSELRRKIESLLTRLNKDLPFVSRFSLAFLVLGSEHRSSAIEVFPPGGEVP